MYAPRLLWDPIFGWILTRVERAANVEGVNSSRLTPVVTPVALTCVCVLAACTAGDGAAGGAAGRAASTATSTGTSTATSAAVTPQASPSPTGLSPERYRSELKAAMKPVRSGFASLAKAGSIDALESRLKRTEKALAGAVERLRGIDPPPEAVAEHTEYVERLDAVHQRLDDVRDDVSDGSLCTSGAVRTKLGKGPFERLETAAKELNARGDYAAQAISVKVPKRRTRRLANGTFIRNGGRGGRGYLRIRNGLSQDAVVTLVRGKAKVLSVYVRKRKSYQINSVRDGTYRIYFTTGEDWDRSARTFTRDCAFRRFEKSVRFRTYRTGYVIRWHNWSLTLHAVVGGNARTRNVKPRDFPR